MPHRLRAVAALLLLLSVSGCCTISLGLASLFCGPRQDPWVEISYRTPRDALETFVAAVARDDVDTICRTLSYEFKSQQLIGEIECDIAWGKLKEQIPGIHLVDQAEISAPAELPGRRVGYTLTIAGSQIEVLLREQLYWEVIYASDPGEVIRGELRGGDFGEVLIDYSGIVDDLDDHMTLNIEGNETVITALLRLPIPSTRDQILSATVGREWKVDAFIPDTN